jgi:signal peptidase I
MEPTLRSGDIVLTNKLSYTIGAFISGTPHVPARNSLVVFKNPFFDQGDPNMFIVKRVIGQPGDRVIVRDGRIAVYTPDSPEVGFNPDEGIDGPQSPTSGNVDRVVPDGEIFVAGDNRLQKNSLDSRNGMSTVPLRDIQGTVIARFWPFNELRGF